MKNRLIFSSYNDIQSTISLFELLNKLDLTEKLSASSNVSLVTLYGILEDFCNNCEEPLEDCECENSDYRYMAEYDD